MTWYCKSCRKNHKKSFLWKHLFVELFYTNRKTALKCDACEKNYIMSLRQAVIFGVIHVFIFAGCNIVAYYLKDASLGVRILNMLMYYLLTMTTVFLIKHYLPLEELRAENDMILAWKCIEEKRTERSRIGWAHGISILIGWALYVCIGVLFLQ